MTGIPNRNFHIFDAVALAGRALGWDVLSPAEQDRELLKAHGLNPEQVEGFTDNGGDVEGLLGITYEQFLATDLIAICERDAIILIPHWENSPGARTERFVAEACGKDVYLAEWRYSGWQFFLDPVQKRMNAVLMSRFGGVAAITREEATSGHRLGC